MLCSHFGLVWSYVLTTFWFGEVLLIFIYTTTVGLVWSYVLTTFWFGEVLLIFIYIPPQLVWYGSMF